jgi:anti-sigma28 factor (negative regulator of flagellin synthesis)
MPIQHHEVILMKGMAVSQRSKRADAGWMGCAAGRAWPKESQLCDPETQETRLEKVNRLRAAIASGEYRVPAEEIAERLLVALFGRRN